MAYTELTLNQKLEALALKYYEDFQWQPKKGDYYTSSRNDLELYQIVDEGEQFFYTKYCDPKKGNDTSMWPKSTFLKDFGLKRVFVPEWILNGADGEKFKVSNANEPTEIKTEACTNLVVSNSGHEVYPDCFQTGKCKKMCMICLNY